MVERGWKIIFPRILSLLPHTSWLALLSLSSLVLLLFCCFNLRQEFNLCFHVFVYLFLPIPIFTSFITASIYTLKSQVDIIHPCLTPLSILNQSFSLPFTLTQAKLSTYILLIQLNNLTPTSYILITCHKTCLLTLSYIIFKSIEPTYTTLFLSCFSTIWFRMKKLIYKTPPFTETPLLILNQTPSHYRLCLIRSPHVFFQPS